MLEEVGEELIEGDGEVIEIATTEVRGIRVAGMGGDRDFVLEALFGGGSCHGRGSGVGTEGDVGTGDEGEELWFKGRALAEVGVEVDGFHNFCPLNCSYSDWEIGMNRIWSPTVRGKWLASGSTIWSGVRAITFHPPGRARG